METDFNRRYSLVDNETGEIVPLSIRVLGTKKDFTKSNARFYKVMDTFTESVLMDKELSGKAIKLLFWILKQLNFGETTFLLNAQYAAEELQVTKRTFYNWKKVLEKKEIIKKITGDLYTLNPDCVAYGTVGTVNKKENLKNVLNNIKSTKTLKGVNNVRNSGT